MAVPGEVHVLGAIAAARRGHGQQEAVAGFMKGLDIFVSFPTVYGKSIVWCDSWLMKSSFSCFIRAALTIACRHKQLNRSQKLNCPTQHDLSPSLLSRNHFDAALIYKKTGLIMIKSTLLFTAAQVGQNPIRILQLTRPFLSGNGCSYTTWLGNSGIFGDIIMPRWAEPQKHTVVVLCVCVCMCLCVCVCVTLFRRFLG